MDHQARTGCTTVACDGYPPRGVSRQDTPHTHTSFTDPLTHTLTSHMLTHSPSSPDAFTHMHSLILTQLLIPTSAVRSKRHWVLDEAGSIPGSSLTWRHSDKTMVWIHSTDNIRVSTLIKRADRRVSELKSPFFSPPPRKRGRRDSAQNKGCVCALPDECKRLRLTAVKNGQLPSCQPRLCKPPPSSNKKVSKIHSHSHILMSTRSPLLP